MTRRPLIVLAGMCLLVGLIWGRPLLASAPVLQTLPTRPIPAALFGLHVLNLEHGGGWPTVPFAGWRTFNSAWAKLETRPGNWQFELLDRDMELARQHGIQPLLMLSSAPQWHPISNHESFVDWLVAWKGYVRRVVRRYRGRVAYYELWNEPNFRKGFPGSVEDLVAMCKVTYETIKQEDPAAQVVSPALSNNNQALDYFSRFLALGGGNYCDVIGYHFYTAPRPPEEALGCVAAIRSLMHRHGAASKPLWNTEAGWNIVNHDLNRFTEPWAGEPLSDEVSGGYVARAYILAWASGIERYYWYAWGHRCMGLSEYDGTTPKEAAFAYATIQEWLIGTTMVSCERTVKGFWVCQLQKPDGYCATIMWNPNGTSHFDIPPEWHVRRLKHLNGSETQATGSIELTGKPTLLESLSR